MTDNDQPNPAPSREEAAPGTNESQEEVSAQTATGGADMAAEEQPEAGVEETTDPNVDAEASQTEAEEHPTEEDADGETCPVGGDLGDAESQTLRIQLQEALDEKEEKHHLYLRTLAEMENLRKRTAREIQQARKFAVEGFSKDLLSVADNMERALTAIPESDDDNLKNIVQGVVMIQSELNRVMGNHGITRIESMHSPFDPHLHQAVIQVEDEDAKPGTVVQEMQAGYLLNERLLRPAMVGVAKGG
ncbi:MAG: nucleotide exchange factor GrpE [Magnetococcales bacterium]|nr:nucleotide exchange factor GrpE [Magnetococcales bacterium]